MDNLSYLIVPLLQGFEWFHESLQRSMKARGWPQLTQPEASVLIHVLLGITRPSGIARSMGLTRQAVHVTIKQIAAKDIFELRDDPRDRRSKVVTLTTTGRAMRRDAQASVRYIAEQLALRIGRERIEHLRAAFVRDWGPPIVCPAGYRGAQDSTRPARGAKRKSRLQPVPAAARPARGPRRRAGRV